MTAHLLGIDGMDRAEIEELLDLTDTFAEIGRNSVAGFVYRANEHNPNYLGPAPLTAIAAQVATSHGPSGANIEYVLRLAEALRALQVDDAHVFALERLVRDTQAP